MRRRVLVLLTSLLALARVGLAVVALIVPTSPVSLGNCARVRHGMTEAEAIAILGRPGPLDEYTVFLLDYEPGDELRQWIGPDGTLIVTLDEEGRVGRRRFSADQLADDSLLGRIRFRLGW